MFRRTAYTRLFIIFLVCLLVLESALFALIAWSRSSVQHELNQSTANSLRYLSQQFDDDIANMKVVPVTPESNAIALDISEVETGTHTLWWRCGNANGVLSAARSVTF